MRGILSVAVAGERHFFREKEAGMHLGNLRKLDIFLYQSLFRMYKYLIKVRI